MILTLKVISAAMDFQDGQVSDESTLKEAQLKNRIKKLPSILEFSGFCFNCGTHFAGPLYSLKDYLSWQRSEEVFIVLLSHIFPLFWYP